MSRPIGSFGLAARSRSISARFCSSCGKQASSHADCAKTSPSWKTRLPSPYLASAVERSSFRFRARGLRFDLPVLDVDRPDLGGGRRVAAGVVLADGDVEDALAADAVAGRRRDADGLEGDLRLLVWRPRRSGGTREPGSGRRPRRGR